MVSALLTLPALFATHDAQVPVRFVMTPEAGVPKAGVVNVGLVRVKPAIEVVVELAAIDVLPIVIGNPLDAATSRLMVDPLGVIVTVAPVEVKDKTPDREFKLVTPPAAQPTVVTPPLASLHTAAPVAPVKVPEVNRFASVPWNGVNVVATIPAAFVPV